MRSLTVSPSQLRESLIETVNDENNDYNRVLNGNFVGLYCLSSWFDVKMNAQGELSDFELNRLRTQFLIKTKKILSRLRFPNFIVICAMHYLDLIKDYTELQVDSEREEYPSYYKTKEDNLFLNFVVCLMIANKLNNDFAMKSKYWSRLTKIPIRKINELELVMLNLVLKHQPLVLNFNLQKLNDFHQKLQARLVPFQNYIDDFNAKFSAACLQPEQVSPRPSPKPVAAAAYSSPAESTVSSNGSNSSRVSPSSSYSETSSVSDCSPISQAQVKMQTIPRSITHLVDYIQTPTTNFKQSDHSAKNYVYSSVQETYNYVDFEYSKSKHANSSVESGKYRDQYYNLDIYQC